ncbi:MAG: hypothetical protein WCX64_00120 [Candidatus Micrarchaeia archaeon]
MKFAFSSRYQQGFEGVWETMPYVVAAFLVPIVLGFLPGIANQLLVGTIVNFLLAYCALNASGSRLKLLPLIIVPSIGAYVSGIIFGAQTAALLYFILPIWMANAAYVWLIKGKGLVFSSIAKSGILFASAGALVLSGFVPAAFLLAMGPIQFATALAGGFAATKAVGFKA